MDKSRGEIDSGNVWITVIIWGVVFVINLAVTLINENNFITKCCCSCTKFLGITNRASTLNRSARPRLYWAWDLLDAKHLVTGVVHPAVILALRLFTIVYFVFTMVWKAAGPIDLAARYGHPGRWITFFTNWTFVGLALYAILGSIISFKELRSHSQRWHTESSAQPFTFLDKAFLLTLVAMCTNGIMLTAFYWLVIFDGKKLTVDNPLVHGGNVVIMLTDILITRVPIVTYHYQAAVLYGTSYMVFMWVVYGVADYWRYTSLNGTLKGSIASYIVLFVLLIISFLIIYLLAGYREWMYTGKCCIRCGPRCGCACCLDDDLERPNKSIEFNSVAVIPPPARGGQADGISQSAVGPQQQGAQFMVR